MKLLAPAKIVFVKFMANSPIFFSSEDIAKLSEYVSWQIFTKELFRFMDGLSPDVLATKISFSKGCGLLWVLEGL